MAFAVKLGLLLVEQQAALALALAALEAGSRGLPEAVRDDVLKVLVNTLAVVGPVLYYAWNAADTQAAVACVVFVAAGILVGGRCARISPMPSSMAGEPGHRWLSIGFKRSPAPQ